VLPHRTRRGCGVVEVYGHGPRAAIVKSGSTLVQAVAMRWSGWERRCSAGGICEQTGPEGAVILALAACRLCGICGIVVVTCAQVGILDLKLVIALHLCLVWLLDGDGAAVPWRLGTRVWSCWCLAGPRLHTVRKLRSYYSQRSRWCLDS